ncbi:cytochrome P450 [Metarhizium robertsii]|uniref:Cytochrome P450 CYP5148B3 n=2 Tax=Metarhizium robertsii TaxID=568076 RepID=E9ELK4_METRA|nr:Cytochrome P450 CYP5148B3 [Metarhizium robertsii ARSEF 23]EFZ04438.2 Cytochrome P450 CYP5148B3 [Metarhizium robertsii ARSEF 23]EXV00222.1 cytochrome P450 [Metarhizium robertsii]
MRAKTDNTCDTGSFPFLTHYPELTLDKWAKRFGDLYSVWLGQQLVVVISSSDVAKDLLVTRGAICSSRKDMYIKSQCVLAGRGITVTPYNDTWRKHRRIANDWLHQKAVDKFTCVFDREATDMVNCLLEASRDGCSLVDPRPFAGRCSLNNMLTMVFGVRTGSVQDPLVSTALRLAREFMNVTGPLSNLVDFLPLLQRFPSKFRSRGQQLHRDLVKTYGGMIESIHQRSSRGQEVPDCLATTLLAMREEEELDDLDMAMMASAFMIGGVETTASIMQWFQALMPSYPEIQRRAQDELDRVVGRDRLPDAQDEKNLPYCRAIIKEVERCYNPFWLGTPHVVSEDFVYKGQLIPKDTVLVLNTWTIHHDERRFPEPQKFNPDHYINDTLSSAQSSNLGDANERDHWMFGAGRRICPAILVAEREIFLAISRILWSFTMEAAPGHAIDLKDCDGLSGRSPMPFKIRLRVRDDNVARVLKDATEGGLVSCLTTEVESLYA